MALVLGVLLATQPEATRESGGEAGISMAGGALHPRARSTETLYQELCSLCHGAGGAGDGPTQLERPARNFIAGAYGYGDSLSRVMRTLEFGIPGSAMPAFGETLSVQERTAMAQYVLSLGPKRRRVPANEGDLAAVERPKVLQGAFSDPCDRETTWKGFLVGFPSGVTMQLRSDGLDAVAIYEGTQDGAFARRTDWRGQGGSTARALGEEVWTLASGVKIAPYSTIDGRPLTSKLRSTRVHSEHLTLRFDLVNDAGERLAAGIETIRCLERDPSVLVRTIEVTSGFESLVRTPLAGEPVAVSDGAAACQAAPGLIVLDQDDASATATGQLRRSFVYADPWSSSFQASL